MRARIEARSPLDLDGVELSPALLEGVIVDRGAVQTVNDSTHWRSATWTARLSTVAVPEAVLAPR